MTASALALILLAALVASVSPGPATLAIANTSMSRGRGQGLALASGITTGSLIWSVTAALGLGAVMAANVWMLEVVRYAGAIYLLWLAFKSAKGALRRGPAPVAKVVQGTRRTAYLMGLALHLTNPKAILFFGALYAIGIPEGAGFADLAIVIMAVGVQSMVMFYLLAILFSVPGMMSGYARMRRGFDGVFAVLFDAAGVKILTTRLT
jgi:threonine efflux protein